MASADSYASTPRSPKSAGLLSDEELTDLYRWVDAIPLSRPKRNFTRDFSDGCLCAEVVHHVQPKLVDLHNYPPANSVSQKVYNWNTLNFKILRKLGCALTDNSIQQIVACKVGVVETVLFDIRQKLGGVSNLSTMPVQQPAQAQQGMPQQPLPAVSVTSSDRMQKWTGSTQKILPSLPDMDGSMNGRAAITASALKPQSMNNNASAEGSSNYRYGSVSSLNSIGNDKDAMIQALRDTIHVLQEKIHKLELLLVLKDRRIQELSQ